MSKSKKRRKRRINTGVPQTQTYVENRPSSDDIHTDKSGIPLQKVRHTLALEEDFLNLYMLAFKNKPVDLYKSTGKDHLGEPIRDRAEFFIDEYGCDWEAIVAHYAEKYDAYEGMVWDNKCAEIYNNFSYQRMGLIYLYKGPRKNEKGRKELSLFIQDGAHRSLSLACLLLQEKIKWQPIPYWLWSVQDNVKVTIK